MSNLKISCDFWSEEKNTLPFGGIFLDLPLSQFFPERHRKPLLWTQHCFVYHCSVAGGYCSRATRAVLCNYCSLPLFAWKAQDLNHTIPIASLCVCFGNWTPCRAWVPVVKVCLARDAGSASLSCLRASALWGRDCVAAEFFAQYLSWLGSGSWLSQLGAAAVQMSK